MRLELPPAPSLDNLPYDVLKSLLEIDYQSLAYLMPYDFYQRWLREHKPKRH